MSLLKPLRLRFQQHPDPQLRSIWNWLQLAVLVLPFSSLLSGLGVLAITGSIWRQQFHQIIRRPVNRGLGILSLLMLLSTAFAFRRSDAALGLFNFLPFFVVFAALSELFQTVAQLRRLAWVLVAASVPVVAIGYGQLFLGWSGEVATFAVLFDWTIDPGGNPPGRMASVLAYANILASYLVVTFTLALGLWIEAVVIRGQRSGGALHDSPAAYTLFHRLFLSLAVLGNGAALILTDSRNAWAIAAFACLAFAIYLRWRWLLVVTGAVIAAVLGAAFGPSPLQNGLRTIVPEFFWSRLTDQRFPDRPIASLRISQWKFAWSLAQQRPLTGWGLRNFSPLYESQTQYLIGHPHNLFLMLTAETGFLTTILLVGLVGWIVFQGALLLVTWMQAEAAMPASSNRRNCLVVFSFLVAFVGCTLFSLFDITLFDARVNLLGWLLLAALCGLRYQEEQA